MKRLNQWQDDIGCVKYWKQEQLPTLYTPINSLDILKKQRLVGLVKLSEGDAKTADNFAYFSLEFSKIKTTTKGEHIQSYRGPLIGYNSVLGEFEGTLFYELDQTSYQEVPA